MGVLYRVLNEAQEQELCETTLGYSVLWNFAGELGVDELELDRLAEEFLANETNMDVDFDLHDALGKLARLGLATVDARGRWKATPIEIASRELISNWEQLFAKRARLKPSDDGFDENLMTT